jgi:hypothetical protein
MKTMTMVLVGKDGNCQWGSDRRYKAKSADEPIAYVLQNPIEYEDDHLYL